MTKVSKPIKLYTALKGKYIVTDIPNTSKEKRLTYRLGIKLGTEIVVHRTRYNSKYFFAKIGEDYKRIPNNISNLIIVREI